MSKARHSFLGKLKRKTKAPNMFAIIRSITPRGWHYWHYQKIQYLRIEKVNLIPSDNGDYKPILCVLQIMFYAMYHIT